MRKDEFIKSLDNVRLILGNGFDLHCGLHTKYSDYYCWHFLKYVHIKLSFEKYKKTENFEASFVKENVGNINTWDVFFALNGPLDPRTRQKDWCDVERMLDSSLIDLKKDETMVETLVGRLGSNINWNNIGNLFEKDLLPNNYMDRFMISFIKWRANNLNYKILNFTEFLLAELKTFEKDFGTFIYYQTHDAFLEKVNSGDRTFLKGDYLNNSTDTIDQLCDVEKIVEIDTFNYTQIDKLSIKDKFYNINGSYKQPIFGIDTKYPPNDSRSKFTKTARRLKLDMDERAYFRKGPFDNVIIYGHSLNEADYSYFFSLFDECDLLNANSLTNFVFGYSIYNEASALSIKDNLNNSVATLFYEYAKSKNINWPERLLDRLVAQKRIIFYEIEELQYPGKGLSSLDKEWTKINNDMDLLLEAIEKERNS